jgi:Flp pilus assembly pilin Flp
MKSIMRRLVRGVRPSKRWRLGEVGARLVEYAILLALTAVVSIGAITLVGRETKRDFQCVAIELDNPGVRGAISLKLAEEDDDDAWEALTPLKKRYVDACDLVRSS